MNYKKYLNIVNQNKLKTNKKIELLIKEVDQLLKTKSKIIIAIDGNSGSGKTTLAFILKEIYNANVFRIDDFFHKPFYNPDDKLSQYGSNIDFLKIIKTVIKPIEQEKNIVYQPFDFKKHIHLDPITINYKKINIIEGSFAMHPYLIQNYDYTIFLKVNYFQQLIKIFKRSGIKRLYQFIKVWIPNENKYHRDLNILKKANIVVK